MMTAQCSRGKVGMKLIIVLFITAFLSAMTLSAWGYERIVKGFFKKYEHSSITIDLDGGWGTESIRVDGKTKVISIGSQITLAKIPKNSFIKVISVDGIATEIIVEEVAK